MGVQSRWRRNMYCSARGDTYTTRGIVPGGGSDEWAVGYL